MPRNSSLQSKTVSILIDRGSIYSRVSLLATENLFHQRGQIAFSTCRTGTAGSEWQVFTLAEWKTCKIKYTNTGRINVNKFRGRDCFCVMFPGMFVIKVTKSTIIDFGSLFQELLIKQFLKFVICLSTSQVFFSNEQKLESRIYRH